MTPIQLYTSPILRLDGLKPTENLSACSIQVKFQSGTYLEYDLRGQHLKPSAVEHLVQNLLSICLTSPSPYLGKLMAVNCPQLNATICAVRLHRSSLSGVSEGPLSSVSLTSLTIDSDDASQDSGGLTTLSEA